MSIKETFDNDKNLVDLIEEYLKMMISKEKESQECVIIYLLTIVIHMEGVVSE